MPRPRSCAGRSPAGPRGQPPEDKPVGDDLEWVAGYWHWDDERNNRLGDGCWRHAPPGRDWLPGHWQQVKGGYHWVSGAWLAEGQADLQLLPQPPEPVAEEGADRPPDPGRGVRPGCWVWKETRYLWRPGQWVRQPADWLWQPAQYVWTPGGFLFVDGYWDRPLGRRGLAFAPLVFHVRPGGARFGFEPQHAIQPEFLEGGLFARASKHYYFGDYFETALPAGGVRPVVRVPHVPGVPRPALRARPGPPAGSGLGRGGPGPVRRRYAGQAPRPPRTLVQQDEYVRTVVKQPAPGAGAPAAGPEGGGGDDDPRGAPVRGQGRAGGPAAAGGVQAVRREAGGGRGRLPGPGRPRRSSSGAAARSS